MTDRELLEMAAKAAGYEFKIGTKWFNKGNPTADNVYWNPLTDDGDALRLAVKLNLTVKILMSAVVVEEYNGKRIAYKDTACQSKEYEYEVTRRAIVRAAAEIGRKME